MNIGQVGPGVDAEGAVSETPRSFDGSLSLVGQVQCGLNLFLTLKNPAQMPALLALLDAAQPRITAALRSLHYVHFARFLPTLDGATLLVITVFDGAPEVVDDADSYEDSMRAYLMDFVAVIGDEFTAILEFIADAPRLPVKTYPRDFVAFVVAHNVKLNPFSAYPEMTVIDILRARSIR